MSIMLRRWAFYPPGRVPLGVAVHVNEEDGDVNVETPSSLQVFNEEIVVLHNHSYILWHPVNLPLSDLFAFLVCVVVARFLSFTC
jgi:hypothetical protein